MTTPTKYEINDIDLVYLDGVIEAMEAKKVEADKTGRWLEDRRDYAQSAMHEAVSAAYDEAIDMIRQAIADAEEQERLHKGKAA